MAVYAIGDVHACLDPLRRLIDRLGFDPTADTLWFTGDLVNRGPDSLGTLRFVRALGERARVVLGNHDLHLLAIRAGHGELRPGDTLAPVLQAPDGEELLDWLQHRPLLHEAPGVPYVLVHAGLPPQWDLGSARRLAREAESALRGEQAEGLFAHLYGNQPDRWDERLTGWDRLRYIINAFTRLRFCDDDGRLLFRFKGPPEEAPPGHHPWYAAPGRRHRPSDGTLISGHWSTLGLRRGPGYITLDTGCLWGGQLTAARLDVGGAPITAQPCPAVRTPG